MRVFALAAAAAATAAAPSDPPPTANPGPGAQRIKRARMAGGLGLFVPVRSDVSAWC